MRKLLILLVFLQGCGSVEIHHEEGSLPKLEVESEYCDKVNAKVRSDSVMLTCTYRIKKGTFLF